MFEGLKRFVFANFVLFMVILIVLPPVGVILFGLFFVPFIIVTGFGWLVVAFKR